MAQVILTRFNYCGKISIEVITMKDLTGMKFGKLTAISIVGQNKHKNYIWLCKCDCGKEAVVTGGNLTRGNSKSCGHCNDIFIGQRFGKLTALEKVSIEGEPFWICACDCGNQTTVIENNLKRGNTKSCGCLKINDLTGKRYGKLFVSKRLRTDEKGETWYLCKCDCGNESIVRQSNLIKNHAMSCGKIGCKKTNKTHGMSKSDLFKKYCDIHTRCNQKNNPLYGGRGISVCEEWSGPNGFLAFMEWSMLHGYKEGLSLDRIDVNGNYCPENCRWTTWEVQAQNKRLLPSNKTGVSGVYKKDGKFAAQICVHGKRLHLGTFATIPDAKAARREAELKYWGWTKIPE